MAGPTVWIAEEVDYDVTSAFGDPDMWLLGTFYAHVEDGDPDRAEGLTLDEALEWGRARARRVLIRVGERKYWSAGAETVPDVEPWQRDAHPPVVRRRPENERWKDRAPSDPPISWTVEVSLAPSWERNHRLFDDLSALEEEVAAAVAATKPDAWTREEVDAFFAAIEASTGGSWVAPAPRWVLTFTYTAATRDLAANAVKRRVSPSLPTGWEVFAQAVPAD
jgi:hypothetical protein